MGKPEPPRVQHLPRRRECGRGRPGRPVDAVSDHGMTRLREVDPDLMRASGLELDRDEASAGEALEHPIARSGAPAALVPPRDAAANGRAVSDERRGEGAGGSRSPFDESQVLAFDGVRTKELLEETERLAAPGEDERSRRVAVEPVHDADVRA